MRVSAPQQPIQLPLHHLQPSLNPPSRFSILPYPFTSPGSRNRARHRRELGATCATATRCAKATVLPAATARRNSTSYTTAARSSTPAHMPTHVMLD